MLLYLTTKLLLAGDIQLNPSPGAWCGVLDYGAAPGGVLRSMPDYGVQAETDRGLVVLLEFVGDAPEIPLMAIGDQARFDW